MKKITLKHLLIKGVKCIGLKFYPDKTLQALVKTLPNVRWSYNFDMAFVPNTKQNLSQIFSIFKGIALIDGKHFFLNKPLHDPVKDQNQFKTKNSSVRKVKAGYRTCPPGYLQKLELKKYSTNTARTYMALFEGFINHYKEVPINALGEEEIRNYLSTQVKLGRSNSMLNQIINSIKFYYETVLGMPNRFYEIERPKVRERLPEVLSKEEVKKILIHTTNAKHRCILSTIYSA
ncbi:MAG: phage integrase N-terminal SAM-like domain-containing protein, partial [Bacteroidota bacterium]